MSTLHYLKQITNMLYQIKDLCKYENLRKWLTKFNILPQKIINKYKIEVFKQQLKEINTQITYPIKWKLIQQLASSSLLVSIQTDLIASLLDDLVDFLALMQTLYNLQ